MNRELIRWFVYYYDNAKEMDVGFQRTMKVRKKRKLYNNTDI
jgi:hypothetical protein